MKKQLDYASLFTLRSDGRYMGYWRDAQNVRHALYDRDPQRLYERLEAAKTGSSRTPSFADIASAWSDVHFERIGWQTAHAYSPTLKRLTERYGASQADEITAQQISAYLVELGKRGYSRRTVQMHRDVLNMIYNEAILSGSVKINPVAAVPMPRNLPTSKREMPDDAAIEAVRTHTDHPFALFALICLFAGLRKGEALALRYECVDRDRRVIRVTKALEYVSNTPRLKAPKTAAGVREVVLLDVLADLIPRKASGLIIARDDGGYLSQTQYKRRWASYCAYLGHNITAHQLRHGYATILYEAGIPDKDAQELLGHSSITVTRDVYTHIRQARKGETADRLNEYVSSMRTPGRSVSGVDIRQIRAFTGSSFAV